MPPEPAPRTAPVSTDRRSAGERRHATLRALWVGSLRPRRQRARRSREHGVASVDWHDPQWLAVALVILLLSCADAILTLTLIMLGANEANPFMDPLINGAGRSFVLWKLGLTTVGVTVLVLLARARAFGWLPVGWLLYVIATIYIALVSYELWLLPQLAGLSD